MSAPTAPFQGAERRNREHGPDQPYRGADRREHGPMGTSPMRWAARWIVVIAVPVTAGVSAALAAPSVAPEQTLALVTGEAAVLACLSAAMLLLRWRTDGQAQRGVAGLGLLVLGITLPLGLVQPTLRAPGVIAALVLLLCAGFTPEVDSAGRGVLASVGLAALAAALRVAVGELTPLGADRLALVAAVLWVVLAVLAVTRLPSRRGRAAVLAAAAVLGGAELLRVGALLPEFPLLAVSLQLLVLAVVGALVVLDVTSVAVRQGSRLFAAQTKHLDAESRLQAERALSEERTHEIRSALAAIAGATSVLESHRDALSPADRAELSAAVQSEVAVMRTLVQPAQAEGELRVFGLREVAQPLAAAHRASGAQVVLEIDPDLCALGHPGETGAILQNLLVNAATHAPESPVAVSADEVDGVPRLVVEDRGPGIPTAELTRVFERGHRATSATPGTGLGLFVAARLAREQGARLWAEQRRGGGSRFVLQLLPLDAPVGGAAGPAP